MHHISPKLFHPMVTHGLVLWTSLLETCLGFLIFSLRTIYVHCNKNLLNCLQLRCSMHQPSCHPNSTFSCVDCLAQWLCIKGLLNQSWRKVGVTPQTSLDFLHVNCRQLSKFSLQWWAFIWAVPFATCVFRVYSNIFDLFDVIWP